MIEVDGAVHDEKRQGERDEIRTLILRRLGIKEVRFRNEEVLYQIDHVIRRIEEVLTNIS